MRRYRHAESSPKSRRGLHTEALGRRVVQEDPKIQAYAVVRRVYGDPYYNL